MRIEFHPRLLQQIKDRATLTMRTTTDEREHLIIGYGHDLTARPALGIQRGDRISQSFADTLLAYDIKKCSALLDTRCDWWRDFDFVRQGALLHLTYLIGKDVLTFRRMLHALENGEFLLASNEL